MPNERVNVTDTIEVYSNGKTWDCTCDHGIGTEKGVRAVKCASCNNVLVDEKAEIREDEDVGTEQSGQSTLGDFV